MEVLPEPEALPAVEIETNPADENTESDTPIRDFVSFLTESESGGSFSEDTPRVRDFTMFFDDDQDSTAPREQPDEVPNPAPAEHPASPPVRDLTQFFDDDEESYDDILSASWVKRLDDSE